MKLCTPQGVGTVLVRYGAIPQIGRFACPRDLPLSRGDAVVVNTNRGKELGTMLELARPGVVEGEPADDRAVLRAATIDDSSMARQLRKASESQFSDWAQRIERWGLALELIDLERTLGGETLILYVLSPDGADCRQLAVHAAIAGLPDVAVQAVNADGLVEPEPAVAEGGCGQDGGGCTCSH